MSFIQHDHILRFFYANLALVDQYFTALSHVTWILKTLKTEGGVIMKIKTVFVAILLGATQLGWAAVVDPTCLETLEPIDCDVVFAGGPNTKFDYVAQMPSIQYGEILAGGPNTKFDYVAQMPSIQYGDIV